jgi:uncharacterized protein
MTRRRFLTGAATLAVGLVAGRAVADTYTFEILRTTRRLARLRAPLRVAFLADLHHGIYIRRDSVARWVDAANAQAPDLTLLGGDLVDKTSGGARIDDLLEELARLRAPLGVYAAWGNHDHARFRGTRGFEQALRDAGITMLRNRGLSVRDDLFVAGLDDERSGRPDMRAALRERPAERACLLVSHNPDALPGVPADVDLTLCGHTHGGQIRIPGIGAIITSSRYGRRFVEGWVDGPALGYVSRGLGFSLVPLRVDCPAELTILDLTP